LRKPNNNKDDRNFDYAYYQVYLNNWSSYCNNGGLIHNVKHVILVKISVVYFFITLI